MCKHEGMTQSQESKIFEGIPASKVRNCDQYTPDREELFVFECPQEFNACQSKSKSTLLKLGL